MKKISKILAISALALTAIPTNVFAASETANVKVSIPESLTLTLSADALNFNLEDADLHTDKLTVTAKTNAASGYTISFNTNNDYNDLKHSNVLVEDKIESIAEDKTESTFPETAWAYSTDLEDYTFKKIPLAAENIFTTTEKGENTHDFTVGVRANNLAAGDYKNELIFTAVANPEPALTCNPLATTIEEAVCMQDINVSIKNSMEMEKQYQLYDIRDNQQYWIAKLQDGDVWMTQDLDIMINNNTTLTSDTTDLNTRTSWTPENIAVMNINSTEKVEENMGNYVMEMGSNMVVANDGVERKIGNLYNYATAVAMNANEFYDEVDTMDVYEEDYPDYPDSICPKGWGLPNNTDIFDIPKVNGEYSNVDVPSWINLINAYGEDYAYYGSPMYFLNYKYSIGYYGDIYKDSGGAFWSSEIWSQAFNNIVEFGENGLGSRSSNYTSGDWRSGYSIRCVAD